MDSLPTLDSIPLSLDDGQVLVGFELGSAGDTSFIPVAPNARARSVEIFLETLRRMPNGTDGKPREWWPVYRHLPGNPTIHEPGPDAS